MSVTKRIKGQLRDLKKHLRCVINDEEVAEIFKFKAFNWLFFLDKGAGEMGWDIKMIEESRGFFDAVEQNKKLEADQREFNW